MRDDVMDTYDKLLDSGDITPDTHAMAQSQYGGEVAPQVDIDKALSDANKTDIEETAPVPFTEPEQPVQQPAPGVMAPEEQAATQEVAKQDPIGTLQPGQTTIAQPQAEASALKESAMQKLMAQQEKGFETTRKAAEVASQAGVTAAHQVAGYLNDLSDYVKQDQMRAIEQEQDRQRQVAEQTKITQQAISDASRGVSINPNRFWQSMSTGDKIQASIGIALGAIGGALTGQGNVAMKIIEGAIDRDIEAQKMSLTKKQMQAQAQTNLLGLMRSQFADERHAELAARQSMVEKVMMQVKAAQAQTAEPQAQLQAAQLMNQLQVTHTQQQIQMQQMFTTLAVKNQLRSGNAVASAYLDYLPKEDQEKVVALPGGRAGLVYDKEQKKAVNEATIHADELTETINRIDQLSRGGGAILGERAREASHLKERAVTQLEALAGVTGLRESQIKFMEGMIPDATSYIPGKAEGMIKNLRNLIQTHLDTHFNQYVQGYKPTLKTRFQKTGE